MTWNNLIPGAAKSVYSRPAAAASQLALTPNCSLAAADPLDLLQERSLLAFACAFLLFSVSWRDLAAVSQTRS